MITSQGSQVQVTLQLGGTDSVLVQQLTVAQFPAAFEAHAREDEMRLVELSCGRPPRWCDTLTVDSYNELVSQLYAVNATGFFAYATRRMMARAASQAVLEQIKSASGGSNSSRNSQRAPA